MRDQQHTTIFHDSTPDLYDHEKLLGRLRKDGYLFLRQVVEPRLLERVLADFTRPISENGWFLGDPADRRADPSKFTVEPQQEYRRVYHQAYRSEAFHSVGHSVRDSLLEPLLGEVVLIHPRPIGRIVFPVSRDSREMDFTTPAHQDFVSVQGSTQTYTCWVPLHDVSWEDGPLAVAAGSHLSGVRVSVPARGTGGTVIEDVPDKDWRSAEFRCGDVVIFNCLTVHRGLPNRSDRFRMSTDFRFQPFAAPICDRSLLPSTSALAWDELYSTWQNESLKYHWDRPGLRTVPFDSRYEEERNRQAIEYAKRGDTRAISALQRMAVHDPNPARRELASGLLTSLHGASAGPDRQGPT
ncbi:phytanoyl-CoA dioxygenase family protein [Streptomyces griseoluteus]|uniref:phytanoyl-CoA dioxygenase family protein n=1 Tax=Streptomyces griseoluteus TaxID=29306 RepID=UPI0036A00C99